MQDLPRLLKTFEKYLEDNTFPTRPRELYAPCRYILEIGGKRIRPALLMMAFELFDDQVRKSLPAAAAVELFHNFTLMHDDIMDAAPLRRGHPTVHAKYDLNTGILSGDVMLIFAYQFFTNFRDKRIGLELVRIFNRVAIEVCEGQQLDINFETAEPDEISIEQYLKMIEKKTAVLLGGALELGAVCAKATRADAKHLYHFGRLAGIAFQIQDDFLDTFGDPATFGKQVGGDIIQNKKTLLVLKTLEVAPEADRLQLIDFLKTTPADSSEKVLAVRAIFERNGIPELMWAEQQRFQQEAFEHLDKVAVADERKEVLRETVAALFLRKN